MNKTLTKTLTMWGEYKAYVDEQNKTRQSPDSSLIGWMSELRPSYEGFMDFWYSKEKDNLEVDND